MRSDYKKVHLLKVYLYSNGDPSDLKRSACNSIYTENLKNLEELKLYPENLVCQTCLKIMKRDCRVEDK